MLKKVLTYILILPLLSLLNGKLLHAASTDPVINAMDTGANYINAAGTAQEQVASYATDYMNGKIGDLGDVNGVSKAAKRAEKAKKKAEKLKAKADKAKAKMDKAKEKVNKAKEKVDKAKSKFDDAQAWVGDKMEKAQKFQSDAMGAINDAKGELDNVKSEINNAKSEYDNAKGMINDAKATVNDVKSTASGLSDAAKSTVAAAQSKVSSAADRAPFGSKSSSDDIVTMPAASIESGSSYSDAGSGSMGQPMIGNVAGTVAAQPSFGDLSGAVAEVGGEVQPVADAGASVDDAEPLSPVSGSNQAVSDALVEKVKSINAIADVAGTPSEEDLAGAAEALPELEAVDMPELSAEAVKAQALELKQSNLSIQENEPVLKSRKSLRRQLLDVERSVKNASASEKADSVSKKLKDSAVISNKVSDSASRRRIFSKTPRALTKEISNE